MGEKFIFTMHQSFPYAKCVLLAFFVGLLILLNLGIHLVYNDIENSQTVCTSAGCIKSAATILRNLNTEVDPCEDFYEFACGGWMQNHVIPEDQQEISQFSKVQNQVNVAIKSLLEQPVDEKEPKFYTKAKNLYKSCNNLQALEDADDKPLKKALQLLGGWPVLMGDNWKNRRFDWVRTLIGLRRMGFNHNVLIKIAVEADERNNTINIIKIDEGAKSSQSLRRKRLLENLEELEENEDLSTANLSKETDTEKVLQTLKNNSDFRHVHQFMVDSAVMLGANRTLAEKEMLDTYLLELVLENFTMNQEDSRNITMVYNKMTLFDLNQLIPNVPWRFLLQSLLNKTVNNDDPVIVLDPKYLFQLNSIIDKVDGRTLANYVFWRVVYESIPMLSKKYRDRLHEYNRYFTGQDREEARWKSCVDLVNQQMGAAISSMYVKNYFRESHRNKTQEIVNYLLAELVRTIQLVNWMDEETRKNAVEKAQTMKAYIGYTDELKDNSKIDKLYETLHISPVDFFTNLLLIRKYDTNLAYDELRVLNSRGDWRNHLQGVKINAFYFSIENSVDILPGILHAPFFDDSRPNYLNFGGIGFVVGHEMTHGFDDLGKEFDKFGNYRNWWDEATSILFKEKTKCIIDQYNNYTTRNGLKVNGVLTQGENIADNGGAKEAYKAYQNWVKKNGQEPLLPGLAYTQDQLLFISTANIWCEVQRDEAMKTQMAEDEHTTASVRVNGALRNNEDFLKSFKCSQKSKMNLKNKCDIF